MGLVKMTISKQQDQSLLLQHLVLVVERWQLVFLNYIMKMLVELKQDMLSMKHSLYGIYH